MKSSTTMTRASDRWFGADAGGTYFENAFVLFDEEAATCARRSIGGGVAGRAGRASASLETYAATTRRGRSRARGGASEDESGGEDECVYGMDGDVVPRDAPVVMCVGRRLRDAAEDVRASVEGRRAASRVVVFVGCDEGDEEHATCARELTEACERELARGRAGGVEKAEAAGTTANEANEDVADDDSDWGSWGDEDEDDGVKDSSSAPDARGGNGVPDDGWGGEREGRADADANAASGRFVIKFFPPLMYRAFGEGAFTLPSARVTNITKHAVDALTGESREHRVVGQHLAEIAAHWALAPDYFALGPNAESVSRVAARAKTDPVGVDTMENPRSAAVIVMDREIDLMTPSASRDAWLERAADGDGDGAALMLAPLSGAPEARALDEALCSKSARDGSMHVRKLLREAARVEAVDAPELDERNSRSVTADQLNELVAALEVDPSVALRHRALIQRAKLSAAGLTNEKDMKANRQIIAMQRLTAAALENKASGVCATLVEILKVMYAAGGTAVGHPKEAFALVLAAYTIAMDANACEGRRPRAGDDASPFAPNDELALREAFLGVLLASQREQVRSEIPSLGASALDALDAIRGRGGAVADAAPPTPVKDDEGWGDDDWGEDDWGESPAPPSKPTEVTSATAMDDPEVAAAALEARDAVDAALRRLSRAAAAGRASLQHNVPDALSLYANGLPNPTLLEIISRIKSSTDDRGVCADFVHVAASLGGLLKHAAASAGASIVTGAMGRLGNLINKVAAAPKPSDHDVVLVFVLGSMSFGELSAALAERAPSAASALRRRDAKREFIFGAVHHAPAVESMKIIA